MDKKQVIKFFDAMAEEWDSNQVCNKEIISFILDKGEITEGTRVLDVACGTGVLFPYYESRDVSVTGIDVSPEMVKIAKSKFPKAEVICGDAESYSFCNSFDAVMIYNAFPHFESPLKLFCNLSSALKKGGRLTVAHGMSEKALSECHSGVAESVSNPLPSKEKLAEFMSELFDADIMISDEKMYMVSGIKK